MCEICRELDMDPNNYLASKMLLVILGEAAKDHPWHYKVAPMSESERVWFDLNSPKRRSEPTEKTKDKEQG